MAGPGLVLFYTTSLSTVQFLWKPNDNSKKTLRLNTGFEGVGAENYTLFINIRLEKKHCSAQKMFLYCYYKAEKLIQSTYKKFDKDI